MSIISRGWLKRCLPGMDGPWICLLLDLMLLKRLLSILKGCFSWSPWIVGGCAYFKFNWC